MPGLSPLAVLAGLGQGYEQNIAQGQKSRQANADLEEARARIKQMQDAIDAEEAARKARSARPPSLTGVPGAPPPQTPQGPPPIAAAPQAAPMAPTSGPPAPMPAGAPPPAPPGGPPAPAAPQMGQSTAPPPNAAPGASGGPQSDPSAAFSPEAIQQRYATIYAGMKQANPDLNDEELNDAVGDYIEAQTKLAALAHPQAGIIIQEGRQAEQRYAVDTRAGTAAASLAERTAHDRATELTAANRAQTYAEMATMSHEDRQAAIAAMNQRAANAISDRDRIEASHEASAMARLDEAIENKDWATVAQIQAGEVNAINRTRNPTQPGAPAPAIAPAPKLGTRGGGGAAPAAPKVGEVRKGYRFKGGDPADPKSWVKVQ